MQDHWPILLPLIHASATWAMVGLIWFVQLVHYPLMSHVGEHNFAAYESAHTRRTTWIVAPLMLIELTTAALLVWIGEHIDVPLHIPLIGLALLAIVWVSTFAVQVPAHTRLSRGFCAKTHTRLVRTNWVRTTAWSARGVIALLILQPTLNNG